VNITIEWGIAKDVKNFITCCDLCQRVKHLTYRMEGEYQSIEVDGPGKLVTVDYFGPFPASRGGVQYVFVALDSFSKLVKLYCLKRATTQATLNRLVVDYFVNIGKPDRILSDNGSQFSSPIWKNSLQKLGIKVCFSAVRNPQGNPTERVMRVLSSMLRVYCSDHHAGWSKFIPEIENIINLTCHQTTGFSPYELHFGIKPVDKIRKLIQYPEAIGLEQEVRVAIAKENIAKVIEDRKNAQKNPSNVSLEVGDEVLIRIPYLSNAASKTSHKLFHLFYGPYVIVKDYGNNSFQVAEKLDHSAIKGQYNRRHLRRYYAAGRSD
jgi:transposase InsO family protein